jgi:diguanylate cyclase (GGDEF)-like protein
MVYRDTEKAHRLNFRERALIDELSTRDGLSGKMNRRRFDEHLLRLWKHASRARRSISTLLIDIDHFKTCNDNHGHQAPDLAIRRSPDA